MPEIFCVGFLWCTEEMIIFWWWSGSGSEFLILEPDHVCYSVCDNFYSKTTGHIFLHFLGGFPVVCWRNFQLLLVIWIRIWILDLDHVCYCVCHQLDLFENYWMHLPETCCVACLWCTEELNTFGCELDPDPDVWSGSRLILRVWAAFTQKRLHTFAWILVCRFDMMCDDLNPDPYRIWYCVCDQLFNSKSKG